MDHFAPSPSKPRLYLRQPPGEEALLGGVAGEGERLAVGVGRLGQTAETAQQAGAGGGEEVVAGERGARFEVVEARLN